MVRTSDLEFGRSRVRFSPGTRKFSLPRASIVSPYSKRKIFPGVYVKFPLPRASIVSPYSKRKIFPGVYEPTTSALDLPLICRLSYKVAHSLFN